MVPVAGAPCGVLCGSDVMVAVPSTGLSSLVTGGHFIGLRHPIWVKLDRWKGLRTALLLDVIPLLTSRN